MTVGSKDPYQLSADPRRSSRNQRHPLSQDLSCPPIIPTRAYGLGGIPGACKRFGTFTRRNPAENNAGPQETRNRGHAAAPTLKCLHLPRRYGCLPEGTTGLEHEG